MAVDPNIYALSIQLSLDAESAFSTLSTFSDNVVQVEQDVADAATRAIQQIDDIITRADANLGKVASQIRDLSLEGDNLASSLFNAGEHIITMGDDSDQRMKDLKKQIDHWEEIRDINEELTEFGEDELDRVEDYLGNIKQLIDVIQRKNLGHEEELGLVEDELSVANDIFSGFTDIGDAIDNNTTRQIAFADVLRMTLDLMKEFDKETENFVTTNYRAYGSQQQILQQTRMLSAEFGIFRDASIEAYKVLGDLAIPRDELERYSKVVAMANRFTGVGIQTLGEYSHRMRQAGMDAMATERQMVFFSEAMRKLGLSAQDLTRLMGETRVSAAELNAIFTGENPAQQYDQLRAVMGGLAKQMGMNVDVANRFMEGIVADPIQRAKFEAFTGVAINSMQDLQQAMVVGGAKAQDAVAALRQELDAGRITGIEYQIQLDALSKAYGFGDKQAMLFATRLNEVADSMGLDLENAEDLEEALAAVRREISDPFAEANDTLTAQLRILTDSAMALIGLGLQPLIDILKEVIKWINYIIRVVTDVITTISEWITWLEELFPPLTYLFGAIKAGIGITMAFGLAIVFVAGVLGLIPGVINLVSAGIVGLFSAIGRGLQALGNAVRNVIVPLLALGAAFMMVGVGAYFFAQSVKIVAELGWVAIPALLGMVAVIIVLGIALVVLGGAAMSVAPGILVLAVGFLAMGAAVLMAGFGMKLFADALVTMGQNALYVVPFLPMLAVGIAALGIASFIAAPGLFLLAVAMWALAPPIFLIGFGMRMLSTAINALSYEAVMEAATTLLAASGIFLAAALILTPASLLLTTASSLLLVASVALLGASVVMGIAAVVFAAGVAIMFPASAALLLSATFTLVASTMMLVSAAILLAAGIAMAIGAMALTAGMTMIGGAAAVAMVAAFALGVAAGVLGPPAIIMLGVSSLIYAAGTTLKAGAEFLLFGARLLIIASEIVLEAGMELYSSASVLRAAAVVLVEAGALLLIGSAMMLGAGVMLVPASIMLYAGIWWLESAIGRLANLGPKIQQTVDNLYKIAWAFMALQATPLGRLSQLADAGLEAAPKIDALAIALDASAVKLSDASAHLKEPSIEIAESLNRLETAINGFEADSLEIANIADSLERLDAAIGNFGTRGIALSESVSKLGPTLDEYATQIEAAAAKIETAINAKAIPAMLAAERAGITDVIEAETIATVQIMDQREGEETSRTEDLITTQNALLEEILALFKPMATGEGKDRVSSISELLEQYLPRLADRDSKSLGNELNQWMQ